MMQCVCVCPQPTGTQSKVEKGKNRLLRGLKENIKYIHWYLFQWVGTRVQDMFCILLLLLFSCQVVSTSLQPHGLQHVRLPCPSPSAGVCPSLCPLHWWCHPTISSSVIPFSSCLQSFPASGSFPMSRLFPSGCQSIGVSASASVLPMSIQGWFLLRLVWFPSWPRVSQESSPAPQFESISSWVLCLLYGPALKVVHDYWKDHSLDYLDLCQQSDVFAF